MYKVLMQTATATTTMSFNIALKADDYNHVTHSVSCQFSDIGSHSQLSNEQKRHISKQTHLFVQNLPQRKHLLLEKSYTHG